MDGMLSLMAGRRQPISCHSERSEESRPTKTTEGFFVVRPRRTPQNDKWRKNFNTH